MDYNYNLQEAVSEECYNDIRAMVEANLAKIGINETHLADYIEHLGNKHGQGLVKAAVKGVGNTIKGAGVTAGNALLNSNNKVTNAVKKIPGINQGLKRLNTANYNNALKKLKANYQSQLKKTSDQYDMARNTARYISDPNLQQQAINAAGNRALGQTQRHFNSFNTAKNSLKNKHNSIKGTL